MVKPKNAIYQARGDVEVLSEQADAVPAIGVGGGVVGEWTDEKAARRQAENYVACRGEYGSGMLFSLSVGDRPDGVNYRVVRTVGRVDYRVARIFAKEIFEDGTEKIYCLDEDDPYMSLPSQVEAAYRASEDQHRRFQAHEVDSFADLAFRLGWRGEGWYAFTAYISGGVPVSPKELQAVWYKDFCEWADDFADFFKSTGAAEVRSAYYGGLKFPNSDVFVSFPYDGFDWRAWGLLRGLWAILDLDQREKVLIDISIALNLNIRDKPGIMRAIEAAAAAEPSAAYKTFRAVLEKPAETKKISNALFKSISEYRAFCDALAPASETGAKCS